MIDDAARRQSIDVVLFDIDGTLVDSNDAHARSWVDAFAQIGMGVSFAAIRPCIGMGTDKLLETLDIGIAADSDAGKALAAQRKTLFIERYVPALRPAPGARDLLELLKARNFTCIVASAASPQELDPLLEIADVSTLFDHVVRADEVEATKPDPDIVAGALRWAKTAADRAVMVGDTRFDIEAAHRARVRCVALRCGGSPDSELVEADAIFDSPLEFAAKLRNTPLDQLVGAARVRAGGG